MTLAETADYNLLQLKTIVHEILHDAFLKRKEIGGAVNWADLNCRETRRSINDSGEISYTAYVNEASPTAYELQKFIGFCGRPSSKTRLTLFATWKPSVRAA